MLTRFYHVIVYRPTVKGVKLLTWRRSAVVRTSTASESDWGTLQTEGRSRWRSEQWGQNWQEGRSKIHVRMEVSKKGVKAEAKQTLPRSLRLRTCAMKSFWLLTAWWNLFTSSAWNCFRIRADPFTWREPFPALLSDAPWVPPFITPLCSAVRQKETISKMLHVEDLRRAGKGWTGRGGKAEVWCNPNRWDPAMNLDLKRGWVWEEQAFSLALLCPGQVCRTNARFCAYRRGPKSSQYNSNNRNSSLSDKSPQIFE